MTFLRLDGSERRLLFETLGLLIVVRLALTLLPFARVREMVERLGARKSPRSARRISPARLARMVQICAQYVPGASCLTQAMTGDILLRRRGRLPALRIGVGRGETGFEAHAWIELDGAVLLGRVERLERYTPLSSARR